jgi:polysaccharide export outer membrane protein
MYGAECCILDYNEPFEECQRCCIDPELCNRIPLEEADFDPRISASARNKVSIGDVLEITVLNEEDTASTVTVAPDGRIYYGPLDGIPAAGKTLEDIRTEITEKLNNYFVAPLVTINPTFTGSENFKILGRVQQPGVYPLTESFRLREAIGIAGGFQVENFEDKAPNSVINPIIDLKNSFLVRDGYKMDIDFERLIYDPNSHEDIYVKAGDYIYIAGVNPEEVYVLGAARIPTYIDYQKGMTLVEAIAKAGGWISGIPYGADIKRVLVIRGCLDCPLVAKVNLREILYGEARDVLLKPGDIIYVYNKKFRFGRELVRMAINTFVQSFANAAGSYYAQFKWFRISPGSSDDDDDD